jgi:hypothetical protein
MGRGAKPMKVFENVFYMDQHKKISDLNGYKKVDFFFYFYFSEKYFKIINFRINQKGAGLRIGTGIHSGGEES